MILPTLKLHGADSGRIYKKDTFLELGILGTEFKFRLPCWITISGRRKVVITEVDGLEDTVKEDMGFAGYSIQIQTQTGNFKIGSLHTLTLFGGKVKMKNDLRDLFSLLREKNEAMLAADADGVLSALGIRYIYIKSIDISPAVEIPKLWNLTLQCDSELEAGITAVDLLGEKGLFS